MAVVVVVVVEAAPLRKGFSRVGEIVESRRRGEARRDEARVWPRQGTALPGPRGRATKSRDFQAASNSLACLLHYLFAPNVTVTVETFSAVLRI